MSRVGILEVENIHENIHEVDTNACQGPATPSALEPRIGDLDGGGETRCVNPPWYALWTRSHCERMVWDQLTAGGFQTFLPTIDIWSWRAGVRRRIPVPMFPGYLFLSHAMDKTAYMEVRKTRGLVSILGERWDKLAEVPACEIDAIRKVGQTRTPVLAHTYLREGQRVRITHGPLADVEGILVRQKLDKGLLVLSIELLRRSIAVEVDCTCVASA